MRQIRTALAGLGQMGQIHALAIERSGSFELVAASDTNADSLRWATDRSGLLPYYRDTLEMIAKTAPDLVVVSTPPATHAEIVEAAFGAGADVLCEKPLAVEPEAAIRMARAALLHRRIAVVNFQLRFGLARQVLRQMISAGEIGTPLTARAWFCEPGFDGEGRGWYRRPELGGGALMEFGSHQIDQLRWMLGDVVAVSGSVAPRQALAQGPAEHAVAVLEFASGAIADMTVSARARALPRRGFEVHGADGSLRINGERILLIERNGHAESVEVPVLSENLPSLIGDPNESFTQPLQRLYAHLADAMRRRGPVAPMATFEDGVETLRVVHGVLANHPLAVA